MTTVQTGDIAEAISEATLDGGVFDAAVALRVHDRDGVDTTVPALRKSPTFEDTGDHDAAGVEIWLTNGQAFRVTVEVLQ